ncbi:AraC-like DNA-binding protein [Pseudonocardia endophytica]|uniref:AraC-like DNA-binding protein n=2 Tax=Pseudonocardia endophytica TaxID=401976 RepID=A0A4R1HWE3_PSEEN|nr:AraC-like DNA-binding protein [Pseudonocardia endophytica]
MHTEQRVRPATGPTRFRTADLDVARAQVTETFAEHEMTVADGRDLDFRLELAPAGLLTLGRLGYGADVRIAGPPMRYCYHVNLPISGENTVEQNGVKRTSMAGRSGIAMLPNSPLTMWWTPEGDQHAIKLPKELLETHAAKLAGRPAGECIRFALEFDLTGPQGRALQATTRFLSTELNRPGGLATMPAARHEMESALMTQLLVTIPSQLTPELHGRPTHTRTSRIREVVEYVDAHPDAELTTADLAARAGIGARALQIGFQELVGMTPREYVRGVRLDQVRIELNAGARPITAVAAKWGFFHPGKFAQQYRARFGLLPSDTSRRVDTPSA